MNCIFCKIINNEIPSTKVYEDEDVFAFLDLSQATYGHTLVVPKKHYTNILEVDSKTLSKTMDTVQMLCKHYLKTLSCEGFNILNNCNEIAGQTVMHFHIHIIPRYKDDTMELEMPNNQGKYNFDEILKKLSYK